jgi:hypothetical protein
LVFQRLDVLDIYQQNVSGLGILDVKRTGQVMDPGQINIAHVIRRVIVADLAAGPVDAFNLDGLAILDGAVGGDCDTRMLGPWAV